MERLDVSDLHLSSLVGVDGEARGSAGPAQIEQAVPDPSLKLALRGLDMRGHQRGRPVGVTVGDRLRDSDMLPASFCERSGCCPMERSRSLCAANRRTVATAACSNTLCEATATAPWNFASAG